jgi:hypothetical protein
MADKIVKGNGYYDDKDPRVMRIVEYDNTSGGKGYGLEYAGEEGRYHASQYVRNPRIYWQAT